MSDRKIPKRFQPASLPLLPQVLGEDLVLVAGQQDRLARGADVWCNPVPYDKLGVRYRWAGAAVQGGRGAV